MPGTVQRYPLGLLGLMDLKDMGRGPSIFSDEIAATIDATAYYLLSKAQVDSGQALTINAPGFFSATGLTILSGQIWFCDFAGGYPSAVLGAATTTRFRLAISRANGGVIIPIGTLATGATGERPSATAERFYLQPGDQLGVWCEAFAGVAFNVNLFLGKSVLNY